MSPWPGKSGDMACPEADLNDHFPALLQCQRGDARPTPLWTGMPGSGPLCLNLPSVDRRASYPVRWLWSQHYRSVGLQAGALHFWQHFLLPGHNWVSTRTVVVLLICKAPDRPTAPSATRPVRQIQACAILSLESRSAMVGASLRWEGCMSRDGT